MENEKFNQQDLWGFKDINELEVAQDMPDLILKQQLELLKRKTHGILHVKTDVVHVEDKSEYNFTLATRYDIVVPNLDNYSKTVFVLYSSLERIYPVMITDDKKFHEVLKRIYQGGYVL